MFTQRKWMKVAPVVLSISLVGAACGNDDEPMVGAGAQQEPTTTVAAGSATQEGIDAAAVKLRGDLTLLLRNHVNLTGNVVYTAAESGLDSEQTRAASQALDQNTVALGDAVGRLFGDQAEVEFLRQWREHIGFFVNYAKGIATNNQQLKQQADQNLRGQYAENFSKFISTATNGALPQPAVKQNLITHVDTLEQGIEAVLTKKPNAAQQMLEAGRHMNETAQALAGGFDTAKNLQGDPGSPTAELLATLTGALEQHVANTGYVVHSAVLYGLDAPQTAAAMEALSKNTDTLGAVIGSIYGQKAQEEFLRQWRQHIDFFVNYAKGVATNNAQLKQQADANLRNQYAEEFSKFLANATNNRIPQATAKTTLTEHINTLEKAIESILAKRPAAGSDLGAALRHMQTPANVITRAVTQQFPDKYNA